MPSLSLPQSVTAAKVKSVPSEKSSKHMQLTEEILRLEKEAKDHNATATRAAVDVKTASQKRAQIAVAKKDAERHFNAEQKKRDMEMGKLLNIVLRSDESIKNNREWAREKTLLRAELEQQLAALPDDGLSKE